jgi:NADH-quinone oxidoreductase subunit C
MVLDNTALLSHLQTFLGDKLIGHQESFNLLTIEVSRDNIIDTLTALKSDQTWKFRFLTDLCGIHYPDQKGKEIGVIYHLHNLEDNIRLRVKCFFPEENAVIPTMTTVFPAANWMERETYDFFGIQFTGHPDLRRILNVDEMTYHPLLKQYPLEDLGRTDKDDRFFGRTGNNDVEFDKRIDRIMAEKQNKK